MPTIFNATVDLFAFYLSNKPQGDGKAIAPDEYDLFWQKLAQELNQSETTHFIKFEQKITTHIIQGYYERKKIHDTQSFWFSGSTYNAGNFGEILPKLRELARINIPSKNFLGQTWLITGWLAQEIDSDSKLVLFQDAYKKLTGKDAQYREESKFLGATIFELWRGTDKWNGIEQDSHAMIVFYDSQTSEENENNFKLAAKCYYSWRYLLYCRHKIIWAYQKAMELRKSLLEYYIESDPNVAILSQKNLKELQEELQDNINILAAYVAKLNYLETQKHTVDINLKNYKSEYNNYFKGVSFLSKFIRIATDKYKFQMEEDHASLRPGLSIRENLTATIRGMVEIEQAKSDRIFQVTIGILGVGIGTASITASAISPFIETITRHPLKKIENQKEILIPENAWFNFREALCISVKIGGVSILIFSIILIIIQTIQILKRWHRRSKARKINAKSKT